MLSEKPFVFKGVSSSCQAVDILFLKHGLLDSFTCKFNPVSGFQGKPNVSVAHL